MRKILVFSKQYLIKHKISIGILFIAIILSGICTLAIPIISGNFIDFLIGMSNKENLYLYCSFFGIVSITNIIIGFIANRIYTKMNLKLSFEIEQDIIQHAQNIKLSYFSGKNISQVTQQITADANVIVDFLFDFFSNIIINICKILIPIFIIFTISKSLFALIIFLIMIYSVLYILFKKILYKTNYEVKEKQNIYFGNLFEQLSKIKFLKIHSVSEWFNLRTEKTFSRLLDSSMKLQMVQYSYSGLDTFIMSIGQICLFLIGGAMVINQRITVGEFTLISAYFSMGVTAVRYFFGLGQKVQTTLVSCDRLQVINKEPIENEGNKCLQEISNIKIKDLCFSFGEKTVFQDLNLEFNKGNSYAVLGKNGVGKSTLVNILIGIFKDYGGEILYNEFSVSECNLKELRRKNISVIEQEPELIQDTLYNNVALDSQITTEKVEDLLSAWFDDSEFKESHKIISEKSNNLSGGEKEKIAIIRAILKDSDLIILDEPTAALDSNSCRRLEKLIKEEWKNKIVIIITHDDRIVEVCDEKIYL